MRHGEPSTSLFWPPFSDCLQGRTSPFVASFSLFFFAGRSIDMRNSAGFSFLFPLSTLIFFTVTKGSRPDQPFEDADGYSRAFSFFPLFPPISNSCLICPFAYLSSPRYWPFLSAPSAIRLHFFQGPSHGSGNRREALFLSPFLRCSCEVAVPLRTRSLTYPPADQLVLFSLLSPVPLVISVSGYLSPPLSDSPATFPLLS